jgi:hypothetical protein
MRSNPASASLWTPSRRDLLLTLAAGGGAARHGSIGRAASAAADHRSDWAWLIGNWEVRHRRLRERLAGSHAWDEFAGRSNLWLTMDGLGTIDDNSLALPAGDYRALGIRAFDPAGGQWRIWWLDGRNPTHIDPPVIGGFDGDGGAFIGRDSFNGRPITVRFRWFEIHGAEPHWEQAFSTDDGATWEVNWVNFFTRTAAVPTPLPPVDGPQAPADWRFLVGRWNVHHRRLRHRLAGSQEWDEFGGTLVNWPVMGGQGNVGDNVFHVPGGDVRGVGLRAYDPVSRQWLSWWLDGRSPNVIARPVRGGFANGVGTLIGDDSFEGRPIRSRVTWSRITQSSARWEQAFSADGGATWETNWVSDFARAAAAPAGS